MMQVGAGDGRLTWHLKRLLDDSTSVDRPTCAGAAVTDLDGVVLSSRVECRACDNGARPGLSEPSYAGAYICSRLSSSPAPVTSRAASLASSNGRKSVAWKLLPPRRCPASPPTAVVHDSHRSS